MPKMKYPNESIVSFINHWIITKVTNCALFDIEITMAQCSVGTKLVSARTIANSKLFLSLTLCSSVNLFHKTIWFIDSNCNSHAVQQRPIVPATIHLMQISSHSLAQMPGKLCKSNIGESLSLARERIQC